MKASLRSVRIAPKKAALVAKMIRGMSVPDAVELLEHTNKKAARLLEQLLRSAMANTSHNEKQDPQMMIVKSLTVNKAQAYHRGVPMARGRVRPMRKFLSHIDLTLGFADEKAKREKHLPAGQVGKEEHKKVEKASSKKAKKPVQKSKMAAKPPSAKATGAKKSSSTSTKGKSSEKKKDTAASSSKSAASKKSST